MNEENLIKYYNKFNEDKRLTTRHGLVEFYTSIKYIEKYLTKFKNPKIIDVGAGTGRYSLYFFDKGYDVTSVELVKHNLRVIQKKNSKIKAYQGNALDLKRFKDNSFDIVIMFGPMYHLISTENKIKALKEAKRIVSPSGLIFLSYCMNDFAIIKHGFIDGNIIEEKNIIDKDYKINSDETDLYSFVRLEDINYIRKETGLKRIKILSQDGPSEYIRSTLNKMDDETFNKFLDYHYKTCERKELLGAGRHILEILKKV